MEAKRPSMPEVTLEELYARQAGSLSRGPLRDRDRLRTDLAAELELEEDGLLDLLLELDITPDTAAAGSRFKAPFHSRVRVWEL